MIVETIRRTGTDLPWRYQERAFFDAPNAKRNILGSSTADSLDSEGLGVRRILLRGGSRPPSHTQGVSGQMAPVSNEKCFEVARALTRRCRMSSVGENEQEDGEPPRGAHARHRQPGKSP